MLRRQTELDLV